MCSQGYNHLPARGDAGIPSPTRVERSVRTSVSNLVGMCSQGYNYLPARGDAGTNPSHQRWFLPVSAGTYPSGQRCCAASASHSGRTKGGRDCVATAARSAETKGTAQLPCGSGETQGEGVGDGEISNAECGLACTYCELRTARTDRTGNYRDTGERREPHVAWVAGARAVLRVPQQGWAALHRGQGAQGAWGRLLDRLS